MSKNSFELINSGTYAFIEGECVRCEQWGGETPTFATADDAITTANNLIEFSYKTKLSGRRFLLNALPNSVLTQLLADSDVRHIMRISDWEAKERLSEGFISAVGHELTAQSLSAKLSLDIQFNRVQVEIAPGDEIICALVQTPGRAIEGKLYSEADLLSFPVTYVMFRVVRQVAQFATA